MRGFCLKGEGGREEREREYKFSSGMGQESSVSSSYYSGQLGLFTDQFLIPSWCSYVTKLYPRGENIFDFQILIWVFQTFYYWENKVLWWI